jgi:hypothetical protein
MRQALSQQVFSTIHFPRAQIRLEQGLVEDLPLGVAAADLDDALLEWSDLLGRLTIVPPGERYQAFEQRQTNPLDEWRTGLDGALAKNGALTFDGLEVAGSRQRHPKVEIMEEQVGFGDALPCKVSYIMP